MTHARKSIDQALEELGAEFGQTIALDRNRVALIEFADDIACAIEAPIGAEHVFFHASICRAPRTERESFFTEALGANLFRLSIAGACVALEPTSDELTLCCTMPIDEIDADRLAGALAAIAAEVTALRARFTKFETSQSTQRNDPLLDSALFIRG